MIVLAESRSDTMDSTLPEVTDAPARWITLAHLLRPQGRKGELLAELMTDFPERFDAARVFLAQAGFSGGAEEARVMTVDSFWLPVGKNAGRVVLAFAGIQSISEAETLGGLDVLVPAQERLALEEDAEYVSDLIGCAVFDGDRWVGVVDGVEFPMTPDGVRRLEDAAPLLTVLGEDGEEVLIPYVQAYLQTVDVSAKRIEMSLPEGLVDVNR